MSGLAFRASLGFAETARVYASGFLNATPRSAGQCEYYNTKTLHTSSNCLVELQVVRRNGPRP